MLDFSVLVLIAGLIIGFLISGFLISGYGLYTLLFCILGVIFGQFIIKWIADDTGEK